MTIRELMEHALAIGEYAGLYTINVDGKPSCGCPACDVSPNDCIDMDNCYPGYALPCVCDGKCTLLNHGYGPDKPEVTK